jgi:hypothetical protein
MNDEFLKTATRIKSWPSLQDYNEAIQNTHANLQEPDLKKGEPYTTPLGLPRAITGSFASVYRIHCGNKDYALRLFLTSMEDQSARYLRISDFVQKDHLPYTVTFKYLEQGIKIRGDWLPALKMEWVEGVAFDDYIIENLSKPKKLRELGEKFLKMMRELKKAGIAHGDLQHGNIIVCNNELRLVDYDGMYVPSMKNFSACEIGHRNYQHPSRNANQFGPYLDNFSAWIIYASIRALEIEPGLLNQLGGADDCLLFRQSDFKVPLDSPAFAAFEKNSNSDLQLIGRFIRAQLDKNLQDIPYLQWPISRNEIPYIEPLPDSAQSTRSGPRLVRTSSSEWLESTNLHALDAHSASRAPKHNPNDPTETKRTNIQENTSEKNLPGKKPSEKNPNHANANANANANADAIYLKPAYSWDWVKPTLKPTGAVQNVVAGDTVLATEDLPVGIIGAYSRRKAQFDPQRINAGRYEPSTYQVWMLFNPLVWWMLFALYMFAVDMDFCEHAVCYPATLQHITFHKIAYQTRSRYTTGTVANLSFNFKVNGKDYFINKYGQDDLKDYEPGHIYPVWALPSNPLKHLPLGESPFDLRRNDLIAFLVTFIWNTILECLIWLTPAWHKRLAEIGVPVWATVLKVQEEKNGEFYKVRLSYKIRGEQVDKIMSVKKSDIPSIRQGNHLIALCDPVTPEDAVLYDLCLYRPVKSGP